MKRFAITCILFLFILNIFLVSSVEAKKVAMVVKNSTVLSNEHEKKIYNVLKEMLFDVTLVDKNVNASYNDFDLIVIAGRPGTLPTREQLDNFVANIPVNDVPTIAVDAKYPTSWKWVETSGISNLFSDKPQDVYIKTTHPIVQDYSIDQKVVVHLVSGYPILDLVDYKSKLKPIATIDLAGKYASIAFAGPNTELYDGKKVSNSSAIVFFGVTYPFVWTDDAIQIFKNAVNWLINLDYSFPTTPVLTAPSSSRTTNVELQWTSSNHSSGIQYYQFQLSVSRDFNTTLIDTKTTSLNYTATGLVDEKTYYARVRAYNYLETYSEWSNTIETIVDLSDIIIKIYSPVENTTVNTGDSVFVNATVQATRNITSCSASIENQVSSLTYDSNTTVCSGSITIPNVADGLRNLTVFATNYLGTTNSTNVLINIQTPPSPSTSTGSGGGTYSYVALMSITVPSSVEVFEGEDLEFSIVVKNIGNADLTGVKITIDSSFGESVEPEMVNIAPARSQTFDITMKTADADVGNYSVKIKAMSLQTNTVKTLSLIVKEKPVVLVYVPVLEITDLTLPEFTVNESSLVNFTLKNSGNGTAEALVKISLPEGWAAGENEKTVVVDKESSAAVQFSVTPNETKGNMTITVLYVSNNEQKTLEETREVSAKTTIEGMFTAFTGMFVDAVINPIVYIPATIAVVLFIVRARMKTIYGEIKKMFVPEHVEMKSPRVPRSNSIFNYRSWEKKHLRSR